MKHTSRTPLTKVPTADLLRGFDIALIDGFWTDEDEDDPLKYPVKIGRAKYTLGEVIAQILTWGNCHGVEVGESTSMALYELLGREQWPFHSDHAPGTYKQAAQAVLDALRDDTAEIESKPRAPQRAWSRQDRTRRRPAPVDTGSTRSARA
jgi:hypothetical protein